ncbi:hypothetical protein PoB_000576600 [Plakobranchus ocellatus]|uniref:Uncharacterized protein n=1 Tax=Plakobranchus ocellatus TaxID=259542 RepID=A0AAV3Y7R7_9GAST|nr:hypothetical protein PoB_000576600 [Plakobranchus ocellatus]
MREYAVMQEAFRPIVQCAVSFETLCAACCKSWQTGRNEWLFSNLTAELSKLVDVKNIEKVCGSSLRSPGGHLGLFVILPRVGFLYATSPQQGDLRLLGPPSGRGADGGVRTRDRRVPADLRADSQAIVPPTPPFCPGQDAGGGARTRDRRVYADLRADSLATVPPTPLSGDNRFLDSRQLLVGASNPRLESSCRYQCEFSHRCATWVSHSYRGTRF